MAAWRRRARAAGLAPKIPLGMRACAVRVDDVVDVSGFVTPDMRVDVLITGMPPGVQDPAQGNVSRTLLQNIQVLSAGTEYQKGCRWQAQAGAGGQPAGDAGSGRDSEPGHESGEDSIVLRNPLDTKTSPVAGTATRNLFVDPNAAPVKTQHVAVKKVAAPQAFSIEVISGGKQSEEKFATPGGHQ